MAREEDAGDLRVDHLLHDDPDVRVCGSLEPFAILKRRRRAGREMNAANRIRESRLVLDVEHGEMLTREAGVGGILTDSGGSHGHRTSEIVEERCGALQCVCIAAGDSFDRLPRECESTRNGETCAQSPCERSGLAAVL